MQDDRTVPLSTVPVGAHVVHESLVLKRGAGSGDIVHMCRGGTMECASAPVDARVLHLDGDAPRPLRECVGRDVWCQTRGEVWTAGDSRWLRPDGIPVRWTTSLGDNFWPIIGPQPEPATDVMDCGHREGNLSVLGHCRACDIEQWAGRPAAEPAARWEVRWSIAHDGWQVARWESAANDKSYGSQSPVVAGCESEEVARALAAHLNGPPVWTPPAPEPERPTWRDVLHVCADAPPHDTLSQADDFAAALAENGYRVVDTRALDDAIDWLRRYAHTNPGSAAAPRALLDALGVDDA